MKKNFLFLVLSAASILMSCTEKIPLNTGGSGQAIIDTTYVASVESQQLRNVLIEEATGVHCPNCPAGAEILKQAEEANPDRVIIVGLHGGSLTYPINGESKYDFRTDYALNLIVSYFGGDPNKPAAVFDRTLQGTAYFVDARGTWINIINERLTNTSPLNLDITSVYNADSNDFIITVKGAYTASISKKQNLTIMVAEDSIIDAQDDGTQIIKDYRHMHVLRDMVTPLTGTPILNDLSSIEAGRVFIKSFRYKIPTHDPEKGPEWILEHMNIIAFVHNNNGAEKEVQQVAETKLKN